MPEQEEIPPPPKKGILGFGKPEQPQGPDMSNVNNDINSLSRRLRSICRAENDSF
ncbi:hypothetical protein HYX06_02290 [Candidatus Woesearchaeota archaeon]|nr:hypothetical protein [Candidatus Woesearchaeota archaeon]